MAHALRCPRCGEEQRLLGRQDGSAGGPEGIVVECLGCGHTWPRGVRPCATCGGTEVVDRRQTMTRTPRGNQLAVIGTRTIRLCTRCDTEALAASLAHNRPVPDGYAARYRYETGPRSPGERESGGGQQTSASTPLATPAAEPAPATREAATADRGDGTAPSPRPARRRPAPTPPAAPAIVRQAVAESLEAGVEADPTVVVLLGVQLGTVTRLDEVDDPQVWERVWAWVASTWPDPDSQSGQRARQTVTALLAHWRERGWLTRVPADGA